VHYMSKVFIAHKPVWRNTRVEHQSSAKRRGAFIKTIVVIVH
jgi:hypothetical protein